jgi:hypothetical protein
VATQAGRVYLFGGGLGGIEDLGRVAAPIHVCFACTVAVLAGNPVLLRGRLRRSRHPQNPLAWCP